jgi:Mg2+ and Co2+ transporter CorA
MITTYCLQDGALQASTGFIASGKLASAPWIDLFQPSADEEQHVESLLGCDLPTREEMREIEDSRRLVVRRDALLMTATLAMLAVAWLESRWGAIIFHPRYLFPTLVAWVLVQMFWGVFVRERKERA